MYLLNFQSATFLASTAAMALTIGALSTASRNKELLSPGPMTSGHYQIELRCDVCHGEEEDSIQKACLQCHADELKKVDDSHPVVKFKDPRNASRLEKIDATQCVSCHKEHRPDLTRDMGVTLPEDYCLFCHDNIAEERPTHVGLGFETCATAGCHNFHDNSSLYESFLASHLDEPPHKTGGKVLTNLQDLNHQTTTQQGLNNTSADMPKDIPVTRDLLNDWQASQHAASGVNCSACHTSIQPDTTSTDWKNEVSIDQCGNCHSFQQESFLSGKHGMRLAEGLSSMKPSIARLPMKEDASHLTLNCTVCHESHRFNTRQAAVESCLKCHDDEHSNAYKDSPHFTAWLNESRGVAEPGTGVSCATCHMPKVEVNRFGEVFIEVDHNQNNTLRPNEKMIRTVCIHCHGLQYSLDALADKELINTNFSSHPTRHVSSLDMVVKEQQRGDKE
jgi:hypothetical protein